MSGNGRAPQYESLPTARPRALRSGPEREEISVQLEVVTPILGGAPVARTVDEVDVIRTATIRGHLRFWWRALNGHKFPSPEALFRAESELWGRAADEQGGRSAVELRVAIEQEGKLDPSDIRLSGSHATPGAYALWPAREADKGRVPTAPRRAPGTIFRLTLTAPSANRKEVENVLRAWLLFGGYGSRTRRGLGSFSVRDAPDAWLPTEATRKEFERLFGSDIFTQPGKPPCDVPWLAGAELHVGKQPGPAERAWTSALGWLQEFRQGTSGSKGDRAREPGSGKPQPERPSISNWPEADKIRHSTRITRGHPPRNNLTPVWPRAGFGLPIIGQFQNKGRDGSRIEEPGPFELRWCGDDPDLGDRLASPLVVKAMPLAGRNFVPIALWLHRAYPRDGEVILANVSRSSAPFDRLVAEGDTPRFPALAGKDSLRQAFLDWLHKKHQTAKASDGGVAR